MPNEEPNHADHIEARYWEIQKRMDMLEFVVLPLPSRDAITCAFVFTPHKRRARIISGEEGFIIRDPKQRYPETSVITADFVRTLKGVTSDDKELLLIYAADEAASDVAAFRKVAPALWADLLAVMNWRLASPLLGNLALPNAEPLYLTHHPNPERYLAEVLDNLQKVLLTEKRPRTLNCRSGATLMRKLIAFCAEEVARAGRECKARRIKISRGLTDPANEAVKRVRATPKKIAREPRTLASTPAKLIEAAITPEKRLEYIKVTDNQCRRGLYVALSGDPLAVPMLFAIEERLNAAICTEHNALHGRTDAVPTIDTTGVYDLKKGSFTITPAALFRAFAPDGIDLPNRTTPEKFIVEKCSKISDTKITFRYVADDGEARRVDDILFGFDRAESEPEKSPLIFEHMKLVLTELFIEAKNGRKDFTNLDFNIYHRLFAQHLRKEILTSATAIINYILGYITPEEDHAEALERAGKVAPRTAIEMPLKDFAGAETADAETRNKWPLLPQHPKQKAAVIEAIARAMSRDWIVTLIEEEGEWPKLRLEKIPKDSAIETQQEPDADSTN